MMMAFFALPDDSLELSERDTEQADLFRQWINSQLRKCNQDEVVNIFEEFRDGTKLILLLKCLTGDFGIPTCERRQIKLHKLQNIQHCLDWLQEKNVKLVNIRPEDIANGNKKLTLALLWAIIKRFQTTSAATSETSSKDSGLLKCPSISNTKNQAFVREKTLQLQRSLSPSSPPRRMPKYSEAPGHIDWSKVKRWETQVG